MERPSMTASMSLSLRGSASIDPAAIEALFHEQLEAAPTPSPPARILVHLPQSRKNASGQKFAAHALVTQRADGSEARTERRYTEFVALHDEVRVALALPTVFPVPPVPQALQWLSGTPREEQLQQYMDQVLDMGARRAPLPTLTAFCATAPYVAVGTPSSTCVAALPTAAPSQCLAMMRAHPANEAVLAAGAQRLLELSRGQHGAGHGGMLVDAGAVEFLCEALRRVFSDSLASNAAAAGSTPSSSSSSSTAGGASSCAGGACPGGGGASSEAGASGMAGATAAEQSFTTLAIGTLAALGTSASSTPAEVRALLRRCGATELLTGVMRAHPNDSNSQSGCAALIAALVAADHLSPPGLASHFDFMAVELTCLAMRTHRSRFDVQWHACAALHALACRADALAEAVVQHEGVRLICKAMSTYRAGSAARLQASACGALAALADHVPSCRRLLSDYSAAPLIGRTLADFLSGSDGGAAVFVCGARALLTLSDLPPASTTPLAETGVEDMMWSASTLHARRLVVRGVCCEVIAALARERLRLAAAGTLDIGALGRSGTTPRAVRFVADALAHHARPDELSLTASALDAAAALAQLASAVQDVLRAASAAGGGGGGGGGGAQQLASAAEMQGLEGQVHRAISMLPPDDPPLQGLAMSARVEFERWTATCASSFGRRHASPPPPSAPPPPPAHGHAGHGPHHHQHGAERQPVQLS